MTAITTTMLICSFTLLLFIFNFASEPKIRQRKHTNNLCKHLLKKLMFYGKYNKNNAKFGKQCKNEDDEYR